MESIEVLRRKAHNNELTKEAAEAEIKSREDILPTLCGNLYPAILADEVIELKNFLATNTMTPPPEVRSAQVEKEVEIEVEEIISFERARETMDNIARVHCLDQDWNTMMAFIDQMEALVGGGKKRISSARRIASLSENIVAEGKALGVEQPVPPELKHGEEANDPEYGKGVFVELSGLDPEQVHKMAQGKDEAEVVTIDTNDDIEEPEA